MSLPETIPVDVRPEHLFPPLGREYERSSALLSMGWEAGWRRRLVERFDPRGGGLYLDVATGTGLVARAVRARASCRVVGLDLVEGMLRYARSAPGIHYLRARAEQLPFADETFNGLTFTYLLRYVDDPVATLRELSRVVRPGGRIAMLEFARPQAALPRLGWSLYTRVALPVIGRLISKDWRAVGSFLGPSIDRFYARYDMEQVWRDAGLEGVRIEQLGLGAAVVVSGQRPQPRHP
jgi:demethylmenaquinone methyltransferase/2-methoxy-6-polyprenyl-1,4-benzoquinol methylase